MKKVIASVLIFLILVSVSGFAGAITITLDLDTATKEELLYVKQLIDSKLGIDIADVAVKTDETTMKYEELTMRALDEFFKYESWKNPASIIVHHIFIYVFPDGFNKVFTTGIDHKVTDKSIFWRINYSAQNGFGGMNRSDYIIYMSDSEGYLNAKKEGDTLMMRIYCTGGRKDTWMQELFSVAINVWDSSTYKELGLDADYLVSTYNGI